MTAQFDLFAGADAPEPALKHPEGLRYQPDLIGAADEAMLVARVRELPFRAFEFHGYISKRRVVSFGWQYDFAGRRLRQAESMPAFLLALRVTAAAFGDMAPDALQQALVTEYNPGAGIGWPRDKPVAPSRGNCRVAIAVQGEDQETRCGIHRAVACGLPEYRNDVQDKCGAPTRGPRMRPAAQYRDSAASCHDVAEGVVSKLACFHPS